MAPDGTSFVVITCEANLTDLWSALRTLRSSLPVSRIYWHPDERYRDGRHFRIEIPAALLDNPIDARHRAQVILNGAGIRILN